MTNDPGHADFLEELAQFAQVAEGTLKVIERDGLAEKARFSIFVDRMIAIRGTAQQLGLGEIAKISGLGEEIACKAEKAEKSSQIRKCVGSLWDVMTTVQYLLKHPAEKTTEERDILTRRLEATLKAFGGARDKVDADEIERLLRGK